MLRWPIDWTTFPALIAQMDDADPEVATHAAWLLGIGTGYWHGYPDIRLLGPANVPAAKVGYTQMWGEMKGKTPQGYTVEVLDEQRLR